MRRLSGIVLFIALAMAAAAQWMLEVRPPSLKVPSGLANAVRPVWPHPDAVVSAIGVFVLAMLCFGLAARRLWGDATQPTVNVRLPGLRRPCWLTLVLAVAGLGLFSVVLVWLQTTPYAPSYPRWLSLALALLFAALAWNERGRVRLRETGVLPRADIVLETLSVFAMAGVFIWLNTFDLRSWYYFSLGDEHGFYAASLQMAKGQTVRNLFDQRGAFDIIPVMSSYWSGMLMRIFGMDGIGWKETVIVPAAVSLVATYLLARALYGRRLAVITLGMLVTAHYLLAYAHTGYDNIEPLLPNGCALLLFAGGIRVESPLLLALSGLCAALGWYTYYPSRTTIFILGAAVALMVRWRDWVPVGAVILAGFAALFLPFLVVNKTAVIMRMLEQSGVGPTQEYASNRLMLPIWNVGRSLLAFNYNTHPGPYLYGSLAEPVTAALLPLGLAYAVATWRDVRSRFLLVWFVIGITATGVLSKYDFVSTSRLNFMMPVVALFAALAADRLLDGLELLTSRRARRVISVCGVCIILGVVSWGNLYRWFVVSPRGVPSSPQAMTLRAMEQPECLNAPRASLIVDIGIGGATGPALEARGSDLNPEFALYGTPPTWIETAPDRCVIFRAPFDSEAIELSRALEARWPEARPVLERDASGMSAVRVYYPPAQH